MSDKKDEREARCARSEAMSAQPKFEIVHCEAGCMVFHGGEKKHIKECGFYSDSLSQSYDTLKEENKKLRNALIEISQCHCQHCPNSDEAKEALDE